MSLQSFSVLSTDHTTIDQVVSQEILEAIVGNSVMIDQQGNSNYAKVTQIGSDSQAVINQNGNNHHAVITQDGHHNYAEIGQNGSKKNYKITQEGGYLGVKIVRQEHQQISITQTNTL